MVRRDWWTLRDQGEECVRSQGVEGEKRRVLKVDRGCSVLNECDFVREGGKQVGYK